MPLLACAILFMTAAPQPEAHVLPRSQQTTYCNPINVDYGYSPIPDFTTHGRHRATADPAIALYHGDYYLFSTNQWGYWWSPDMVDWHFVSRKFVTPQIQTYDELCAPAIWVMNDELYVIGSTYTDQFPIWKSKNPKANEWEIACPHFQPGGWDPDWFVDDDGKVYLYHGSSNDHPIYGWQIDPKTWQPASEHKELIRLDPAQHGWERFGEGNDNVWLAPFIEGSWMTKHDGKYYLQYGAPGTEFSGYADGVYVGTNPLGPFTYQSHNPFSFKPGGFARGAGHGATFQDKNGAWWHVSTITIAVKNNFERRIGIWPAGFDRDGILFCDQAYGDYPTYLPRQGSRAGRPTGWMLLNYNKPVTASSSMTAHPPNDAVDESIKTYWSAKTGNEGEWLSSDLGEVSTVRAIQINYADQDAEFLGKSLGVYHRYRLLASLDGKRWWTLADKSKNDTDVPHDYLELSQPVEARYLKIVNIHMPTGKFAISGFRVFGFGHGSKPAPVKDFVVWRSDPPKPGDPPKVTDRRAVWIKWAPSDDATGYVIRFGVAPDKLYSGVMVYGANEYYVRSLDRDTAYYFKIEAFNENGISVPSKVLTVP